MKKFLQILLVAVLIVACSLVFADYTEQENFADYGQFLQDLNLIQGDANGNLNPNNALNREEAVVIILRMLGEEAAAKQCQEHLFSDVKGHWAEPYVNYAKLKGLVNGVSASEFGAGEQVTIKQLYTMFLRAAGYTADWSKEDIVKKAEDYGLSADLATNLSADNAALRGHAFIIFTNAIVLPTNPDVEHNSCVLTKVLSDNPNVYQLLLAHEELQYYLPDSYQADYEFIERHNNHGINTHNTHNKHDNHNNKHGQKNQQVAVERDFELVSATVNNKDGIVLEFSDEISLQTSKDNIEVYGSYGKNDLHYESFYTNPNNYKIFTSGNTATIKFYEKNGKQVDNLSGLTFTIKYEVDNKIDNAVASGKEDVKFNGKFTVSGSGLELVKAEASPDAKNVINLWFNQQLYYRDFASSGALKVTAAHGDYAEYSEEWFLDENNYVIGTTDKKAYIRYMDGAASVDLDGISFEIEYDVKARENDDKASGSVRVDFER